MFESEEHLPQLERMVIGEQWRRLDVRALLAPTASRQEIAMALDTLLAVISEGDGIGPATRARARAHRRTLREALWAPGSVGSV